MGERAAKSIRELCDPLKIVARHLTFRRGIVNRGAKGSLSSSLMALAGVANEIRNAPKNISEEFAIRRPELVSQDIPTNSATAPNGGWHSKLQEPLATVRCLLANPKVAFRTCQQLVADLARHAQKRLSNDYRAPL
jgi:hypothetical protein